MIVVKTFKKLVWAATIAGMYFVQTDNSYADSRPIDIFGISLDMSYSEMSSHMAKNGYSCTEHIKNQLLVCSQASKERDELLAIVTGMSFLFTADVLLSGQEKTMNEMVVGIGSEIASIPHLLGRTKLIVRHSFNDEESITFSCAALSACSYEADELIVALAKNQITSSNELKIFTPNLLSDLIPLLRQNFGRTEVSMSKEKQAVVTLLDRMTDNVRPRDGSALCVESDGQEELCVVEGSIDYTFPSVIVTSLSPDTIARLDSLGASVPFNAVILRKRSLIGLQ